MNDSETLFCHRCACLLKPGEGNFFVVQIESFADPTPQAISQEDLGRDLQSEMQMLLRQMEEASESELREQIYRRMTLYLCDSCYQHWIENPTGD